MCMLYPMLMACIILAFISHSYIAGGVLLFICVTVVAALLCCTMNACSGDIEDQWWVPHCLCQTISEDIAQSQIQALPKFKFKRGTAHGSGGVGTGWTQCIICLRVVKVGEMVRQLPRCSHLFHVKCIDKWLASHQTCPLCRQHLFMPLPLPLPLPLRPPV